MPKTKRQLQAENTRKLLLETARKQIGELGLDNVTIQSITEECGLSKGLFYHYFASKDEMLHYVERDSYIHMAEDLDDSNAPFFVRLRNYIIRRLELMGSNDPSFSKQWMIYCLSDAYHEKQGSDTKVNFDFNVILSILSLGVEDGYLVSNAPIHFLAKLINFTLYGTTLCYRINHGGTDIDAWKISYSDYVIKTCLLTQYGTDKMRLSMEEFEKAPSDLNVNM